MNSDHLVPIAIEKLAFPSPGPIAIVMPLGLKRGGCEVLLCDLLKANRAGPNEDFRICLLDDGPMRAEISALGYRVHVIEAGRLRQVTRVAVTIQKLSDWFRAEQVVHALSWMEKAHLYVGPAAWLAGISSSWWLHSIDPDGRMIRLIAKMPADHIFSSSAVAAGYRDKRRAGCTLSICHCGTDLRRFSPDALPPSNVARGLLGLPVDRPVICLVARLQRWKGVDVFIDAAARVVGRGVEAHFVVVGGEHELEPGVKAELETQIARLGVQQHVRLAGFQADVPLWMQAADTVVHASTGIEPFGIVVIEALAMGKNVIAAKAGGPLEIMTDGVHGRLTPPGDADALAEAIVQSIEENPANARMRLAARSRALDFSIDQMAGTVSSTLRSVIARATHGSERPPSKIPSGSTRGKTLRVGLVMPLAISRGGCETQLINLLTANVLANRIDYSICFLEDGPMVQQVRQMGYAVRVIEAGRLRQVGRYVKTIRTMAGWIRSERLTHVISWMEKAHLYAGPAAMMQNVPSAWWLRSIDPGSYLLRLIDRIPTAYTFACSTAALDAWKQDWRRRRAGVCYSAVNLERFNPITLGTPEQARRALGLPMDRPIVGIVARLQRWKGIDVLLAAAVKLKSKVQPYIVVIGGEHALEPDVLPELQAQAARLGISDRARFAGYQPNTPLWMQACDVVVHTSTRPEPLGIVIVEAMALGKQVIAADEGGPREIITNGVDGRLTPPGDADVLAAAINAALVESESNRRIAAAAAERALFFRADRMAERLADTLHSNFASSTRL